MRTEREQAMREVTMEMGRRDTETTNVSEGTAASDRYGYLSAAAIAGLALVIALAWGWMAATSLMSDGRDAPRTAAPGEITLDVEDAGTYHVVHEQRTWFANLPARPDVTIDVADPDGEVVALDDPTLRQHLRLPGYVAGTLATFEASTPGEHRVVVAGELDGDETIAVAQDPVRSALQAFLGPVVLLVFGLVIGTILALRAYASQGSGSGQRSEG